MSGTSIIAKISMSLRHSELIPKYNIGLKFFCNMEVFYGDLGLIQRIVGK